MDELEQEVTGGEVTVPLCRRADAFCDGDGLEQIKKDVASGEVNQPIVAGCSSRVMAREFDSVGAPVVRALIMCLVFFAAILLDRQWRLMTNIAMAALIILLINPTSLYATSFQLSFMAVISIAYIYPKISTWIFPNAKGSNKHKKMVKSWLLISLGVSFSAVLGTAPLVVCYFNLVVS